MFIKKVLSERAIWSCLNPWHKVFDTGAGWTLSVLSLVSDLICGVHKKEKEVW